MMPTTGIPNGTIMHILLKTEFRTQTRGYTLFIERDLFGDLSIVRCWYGLYNRRGGHKRELVADFEQACDVYRRIVARRLCRGYAQLHEHEAAA